MKWMMHTDEHTTFFIIDLFLALFIVFSNVGALGIIFKNSKIKNSKNTLLISLAVADVCIGLFVIPNVMYMSTVNNRWKGLLCKLCLYFESMSNAASVFTLAALAVDRFRALVFPLKMRAYKVVFLNASVVTIWVMSFLYGLRSPLVFEEKETVKIINNITTIQYSCFIPQSLMATHAALSVFDFVLIFVLPAMILTVCNISVSVKLRTKSTVHSSNSTALGKRKRAIRLLLLMIFVFIVCHFPLYYYRLARRVLKHKASDHMLINHTVLIISFLNSFLNVFFYGSLNDEVKAFICRIGSKACCRQSYRQSKVHPLATLQTSGRQGSDTNVKNMADQNASTSIA